MSRASTTPSKKKQLLNTVTVNLGCGGGSCRRPKLSSVFTPKPKIPIPNRKPTTKPSPQQSHQKTHFNHVYYSSTSNSHHNPFSSSSDYYNYNHNHSSSSTTSSSTTNNNNHPSSPLILDGLGRRKSMAIEKDSVDPYIDFRASMLQMIVENEIYSKDRLRELLNWFLKLNSHSLHGIIIRAFTEIWNSVFSTSLTSVEGNDEYGGGSGYYNWNNDYSCNTNYSRNYRNGRFRSGYYASPTVYVRPQSYEI